LGVAIGLTNISGRARALDRDAVSFSGIDGPIRDYEAVAEITYQAQITPNWMLQPVFQYIVHPGGHIQNPLNVSSNSAIPNASIFGIRTMVKY
jgi:porin